MPVAKQDQQDIIHRQSELKAGLKFGARSYRLIILDDDEAGLQVSFEFLGENYKNLDVRSNPMSANLQL